MLQYDGLYNARYEAIDGGEVKVQTSQRPTRPELISGFRTMKQAYEYCYSPQDGMLVHRRVTPQQFIAGTHLYTWVRRDKLE